MGYGSYSVSNSMARSASLYSADVSRADIFKNRAIDETMKAIKLDEKMRPVAVLRECRDSPDHPTTVPIIIGLDVTGSMGYVPDRFIREEMTKMMNNLYTGGVKDAQVLFLGIGDHECDRSPLQVGQFEADDQLMDKWLKSIYLEGGGGGNGGESYLLAWAFAARQTLLDATKRGKKGFLFTIGDEPNLPNLPADAQKEIFGSNGEYKNVSDDELFAEASKTYEVYHIHILETSSGARARVLDGWKQKLGDHVIAVQSYSDIAGVISKVITSGSTEIDAPKADPVGASEPKTDRTEGMML